MSEPVLSISNLNKSFGPAHIIRDLSLDVMAHERHAIIGPNGAGKSSLFNLLSGRFAPSSGSIRFRGTEIGGMAPQAINRLGLGRSFQITNVYPKLSVFENIRLGLMGRDGYRFSLFRLASGMKAVNEEADALIDRLRLRRVRDRQAGSIAYSDQRALEVGMTLATGADVLLLDEPMAGMSLDETRYTVDLVREVTEGKTLLIVEHDMGVVFSLCTRISVLVYGAIIATGTPEEIRNNAAVQEAYLGQEAA